MLFRSPIKYERKHKKPMSQLELERIRLACKTKREVAIIEMLYSTGCRVSELERLNISVDKANSGVAATRNLGLRQARGKYLQFVDADDTIQPYATEMLVARAEESGADLVIAHYNRITPPRPRSENSDRPERPTKVQTFGFLLEGAMTKEEFAAGLMQEPASFYYGVMWNKLYRADIVHAHDDIICAEDMDWSEDLYFNLSYIRYAEKFYALSTPIYNYYNTPGSAVHTVLNPVNIVSTRATLFAYYKELYEHLGLYEETCDLTALAGWDTDKNLTDVLSPSWYNSFLQEVFTVCKHTGNR